MGNSYGTGPLGQSVKASVTSLLKGPHGFQSFDRLCLKSLLTQANGHSATLPRIPVHSPHIAPSHSPLPYTDLISHQVSVF